MIKVLHVLSAVGSGGVESMLLNYYKNIDRGQVVFDLVVHKENSNTLASDFENLGSHVFYITSQRNGVRKNQRELRDILSTRNYDIVHFHHGILSLGVKLVKKYSPESKTVVHSHGSYESNLVVRVFKLLLRKYVKRYGDYFCACSKKAGAYAFGDKFVELGKVAIIYNAIDLARFQFCQLNRMNIRQKYNISDDEVCVGVVGRMSKPKNPFFIVELANQLRKRDFKFKLIWVGDGELRKEVEKKMARCWLSEDVILTGVKKNINEYYSAFDVFVLPSKNEGLGIVAVEAQQNGVPVLISNKVPNEVIITDNCKSLPLDLKMWCNEIVTNIKIKKRIVKDWGIGERGYDIEKEGVKLLAFYNTINKRDNNIT